MYHDSVGVPTIGIGFNLARDDAHAALTKCGCNDVAGILAGHTALTPDQIAALFSYSFEPILSEAQNSIARFERLSPARQFVVVDMVFNLGAAGWNDFRETRALLSAATATAVPATAHNLYVEAANHLELSAWYSQVGNRARRDVAMIRSSAWADATGDGSI